MSDAIAAMFIVLVMALLFCLVLSVTIIPWALGIAHMWQAIFG